MLKKLGLVILASVSLVAVAQNGFVEGAHGRGVAVNREGQRAVVRFEVARVRREGQEMVRGWLNLNSRTERATVEISMRCERLAVTGSVAEWAGPGRIAIRTRDGVRRMEGRVQCRAADNRREGQGDPDTINVAFSGRDNFSWTFAGAIREGQIIVKDNR